MQGIGVIWIIDKKNAIYGICSIGCYLTTYSPKPMIKHKQKKFFKANDAYGTMSKGKKHFECGHDVRNHGRLSKNKMWKDKILINARITKVVTVAHNISHGPLWFLFMMLSCICIFIQKTRNKLKMFIKTGNLVILLNYIKHYLVIQWLKQLNQQE